MKRMNMPHRKSARRLGALVRVMANIKMLQKTIELKAPKESKTKGKILDSDLSGLQQKLSANLQFATNLKAKIPSGQWPT